MHYSSTVFGHLVSFLSKYHFEAVVRAHLGDRYTKKYDAWNQLIVLLYAQTTGKESLREIETGLSAHESAWFHLGIRSTKRSTLSDAHTRRDWRIFESTFYRLLEVCIALTPEHRFSLKNPLYALDSTMIEVCLSLFPWATYRTKKGALKLHTLLNVRTGIPEFLTVTDGSRADITEAKNRTAPIEPESIVVFDRGFVDYQWWNTLNARGIWFVTRAKTNQRIFVAGQHEKTDARCLSDEKVYIGEYQNSEDYPSPLRRIIWRDADTGETLSFLTNNFLLRAEHVAFVYKRRWDVELFFKWIKQNLKIKTFLGTSKNAVLSQIWAAMIFYLLVAYIKFQTRFKGTMLELVWMFKETLMLRRQIVDLLSLNAKTLSRLRCLDSPQLKLW